ncbi:EAL domain-containing protein [Actinoplanes campanulatus]|nr:EAL domain-containing protein [Actinoplanes campanulatus]
MAMYQAKKAGGDTVRVVTDVGAQLGAVRGTTATGVVSAIRSGELRLHYQPIRSTVDNRIVSIEALVRWQHPVKGLLAPDRFLPEAERAGQLRDLDDWVLRRACSDMAELIARLADRVPEHVNVNVSVGTLRSGNVAAQVLAVLGDTGLAAGRLRIEVPETVDLTLLTAVVAELQVLHRHGVAFTFDDMGAGSSTLRHLSVMPVAGIKIDRAFVHGMLSHPGDHAVVRLLTELGRDLDLPTTAEGVETPEQLAVLRQLRVPYAQGYLLGRPLPLEHLVSELESGVVSRS